ncbi:cyclin-dependent kinase inhibitor 3 family protein [Enterovibrio nigricans]|uniref:Protein-tyrosine phosphatase n=1 Tax=Enterovibrio nigricans DSM 22720 TaxID=1121868 RepID=A0A1T4UAS4_9GAMM|nr:cyclin-dependent kinase inhibitor 3 family protein [Enterovibrio nigricans]PKF51590.1 phosphatase [Enterovibrio nigricans]SKA49835.1 Protein-tyrosine phosphatase [Enterovibrio nigricans DSM 22720]
MTHPTWELPLENAAGLVLTPCPGTKDVTLSDSIAQLKEQGVTVVVTALNQEEMDTKGVGSLPEEVKKAGLAWFHAPIEDDCAPEDAFQTGWKGISPSVHQALDNGEKVALHCMGGSGRTGLLAAHILLEKGWALPDIVTQVQALRPGAFTKEVQVQYINQFANK